MNNEFYVRPARLEDSLEIVTMHRDLAEYCHFDTEQFGITEESVRKIIEARESSCYFVAKASNTKVYPCEPVGMVLCHKIPLGWLGTSGVYVEDLYVREEYRRGHGIGRILLAQACRLAVEFAGATPERAFLRLDTDIEHNDDTLAFYDRFGMSKDQVNRRLVGKAVVDVSLMVQP